MKSVASILVFTVIIISCTQNKSDQEREVVFSDSTNIQIKDSILNKHTETAGHYIWTTGFNSATRKDQIKKLRPLSTDSVNANTIIHLTNNIYSNVILRFVKTSGDTIYVKIPESAYLTQQMGTTGAEMYLANATFNLTELPGIKYVNFDMKLGDHAGPATYSREDFSLGKEVIE